MRNTFKLLDIDLRLFDGAAGAAGDGSAAQGDAGALPKAETKASRGSSRRGASADLSNIVFGSEDEASPAAENTDSVAGSQDAGSVNTSGVETTSDTLEARRAAFEELISGEYKDLYDEKFQKALNRRFKETRGLESTIEAQKPVIDMLMQRYNITDGNMAKLQSAIEQDKTYWEAAAEEAGLTVEQYQAQQKMARENAELKARIQRQQGIQQAQQQLSAWQQEAAQVKKLYPSFDFNAELRNKAFTDLLKARVPVQHAYELIHMDEIKNATARSAAETAGKQMIAKVKSNSARPLENGTSSQSAAIVKNDVHNLTREERAEAARRAQRGEKITFRGSK